MKYLIGGKRTLLPDGLPSYEKVRVDLEYDLMSGVGSCLCGISTRIGFAITFAHLICDMYQMSLILCRLAVSDLRVVSLVGGDDICRTVFR